MRELVISNLLSSKDEKNYVTVVKPLGNGAYQVRDSQGRVSEADSTVRWAAKSRVVVKDGFIVGKTSKKVLQRVYQV